MSGPIELELLVREGCHLCDEARASLREVAGEDGREIRWTELDIDSDERLLKRYLERIPVVRRAGEDLCELVIEPTDLRAALASSRADG